METTACHKSARKCDRYRNNPAVRALCWTISITLILFIFSAHAFWRDPHSWFFDGRSAYKFVYSQHRREIASAYIAAANTSSNPDRLLSESQTPAVICAGMVTIQRNGVQYLSDAVGSMLAGLTHEERSAIDVQLLFGNTDPTVHPNYNDTWLGVLDSWAVYNVTDEQMETLKEYERLHRIRAKAAFDYAYMLEQCYETSSAPYIALIEDDIIFAANWLPKTMSALAEIREKSTNWLYLRLFYTEFQLGWDKTVDSWYTNPIFLYALAIGLCLAIALAVRFGSRRSKPGLSQGTRSTMSVLTLVALPAFVTLCFMIGKDSLLPRHQSLRRMDRKGCCNQALIYPRSQVHNVVDMLRNTEPGPTDWMLEDWANDLGLARYAVSPPVVQHVGLVSSRGMPRRYAQETFAFWFEQTDAESKEREHETSSRAGIWRAELENHV